MPVPLRVLAGGGFQSTSFLYEIVTMRSGKGTSIVHVPSQLLIGYICLLMLPIVPGLRNIGANFVDRLSQPLH